jgi:hypothetical protein
MGKKKVQHATHSFNDTVAMTAAKIANERLMPEVDRRMEMHSHVITQKLARIIMNPLAEVQLSQICLMEEMASLQGISYEDLVCAVAVRKDAREDAATGQQDLQFVEAGAKVLLTVKTLSESGEASKKDILKIHSLMNKVEDKVQTFEALESQLIGQSVGTEDTVMLDGEEGEPGVKVSYKIERISKKSETKEEPLNASN